MKCGRSAAWIFVLTALVLGWSGTAAAQSTGTIRGIITDAQGGVTPGVSITIRNTATGIERSAVSDSSGEYVAASLPPGPYRVEAQLQGFQTQARSVDLGVAQTIVADLRLGVAGVAEQVNVTA